MVNGLSSINKNFIIGLGRASSGKSSPIPSGSKGDSLSIGLRQGAKVYAQAVKNLNNIGGALNLSRATLDQLLELTDKAIDLAEKSTKHSTQDAKRRKLDREFQQIGTEFRNLVENAKVNDKDILTSDGIKELFLLVGIDDKRSRELSELLTTFITPREDNLLASEEMKGGPVKLPAAVQPSNTSPTYQFDKISNSAGGNAVPTGLISSVNNVFIDDDNTYVSNNPGSSYDSLVIESEDGSLSGTENPVEFQQELLAVSENSGYSLIWTDGDPLDFGTASGNLYVINERGEFLEQITDFGFGSGYTRDMISNADLSSDGQKVVFSMAADLTAGNADGSEEVFSVQINTSGDKPNLHNLTQVSNFGVGTEAIDTLFMNESGTHLAYEYSEGLNGGIFYDDLNGTSTDTLNSIFPASRLYGFSDDQTVIHTNAAARLVEHDIGTAVNTQVLVPGASATQITISESGYVAFYDTSSYQVKISNISAPTAVRTTIAQLSASDVVNDLSIAANNGTTVDVGILGTLVDYDSSNTQLYRLRENITNTTDVISKPDDYTKIFETHIRDRSNAFRILEDLKELKSQIEKNIDKVDDTLGFLQDNIDVVRAAGLAFLEYSNKALSSGEAEEIARLVQREIRQNAGQAALAQAANLSPIAAAALISTEKK